jgi:hypothetical protein
LTTFWRFAWRKLLNESSWWRATCSREKYAFDNTLRSIRDISPALYFFGRFMTSRYDSALPAV